MNRYFKLGGPALDPILFENSQRRGLSLFFVLLSASSLLLTFDIYRYVAPPSSAPAEKISTVSEAIT